MSATQRGPRRLSARLQEKEDIPSDNYSSQPQLTKSANSTKDVAKMDNTRGGPSKKRKNEAHDEDDDGFTFSRVKKKKQKAPEPEPDPETQPLATKPSQHATAPSYETLTTKVATTDGETKEPVKRRRNKMSFSTPLRKEVAPVRRSKRLSDENDARADSPPPPKGRRKEPVLAAPAIITANTKPQDKPPRHPQPVVESEVQLPPPKDQAPTEQDEGVQEHAATRIALPFADTPVIRRNKAMREHKSGKGERRSSLSLRGRRASSLIDSGNSNALPHSEVEIPDFYKHIESDGLLEPRRMRQLLTWCATRALDQKPLGADFEDASAIAAARVIEEELLKDLSNRSELSDWFAREDVPLQPKVLPERPNPKNQQNAEKIHELEEQIKRLRIEKDALESLLIPPSIPQIEVSENIDTSLLDESDLTLLNSLQSGSNLSQDISNRLRTLQQNIGPTIDAFADGIHRIGQYRDAAENIASSVLSICSEKLAERDKEARKRALNANQGGEETSPRRDLNSVLRGLSRADR